MYCKKCGKEIPDGVTICPNCGNEETSAPEKKPVPEGRFLPSFILGLIAAVFGISGGFCMTMCSSFYSSGFEAFFLIFGGSIVGLIGACKCLSKAMTGSILQLVGAVMITICAYGITGSGFSTIFALVLFYASGIIGLIYSLVKLKK